MHDLPRRTFLGLAAAVLGLPLTRPHRPKARTGFGSGGFGLTPFGS